VYTDNLANAMSALEALFDNHMIAAECFNLEVTSGLLGAIVETPQRACAFGRLEFNLTE